MKTASLTFLLVSLLLTTSMSMVNQVSAANGPITGNLFVHIYSTEEAEFSAFESATGAGNAIDFVDWPIRADEVAMWQNPPYNSYIQLRDYSEIGRYGVDINNQRWPTGVTEPRTFDPATGTYKHWFGTNEPWDSKAVEFRKAIAYLSNKNKWINDILKGYGHRLDTDVPLGALSGYTDYADLRSAGYIYDFNPVKAGQVLDAAGFIQGTTANPYYDPVTPGSAQFLRTDPKNGFANLEPLVFYIRMDDVLRRDMGRDLTMQLRRSGIPVDAIETDRSVCYDLVMVLYDYHLYTGGSDVGGLDADIPDYLYDQLHSSQYWGGSPTSYYGGTGWSRNYIGFVDATYDACAQQSKFSAYFSVARSAGLNAQKRAAELVHSIPGYDLAAVKAFKTGWSGIAGESGKGPDNRWAFLNGANGANTPQNPADNTIDYAFKSTLSGPNPVTSQWLWDRNLLGLMYDSLLGRNPYNLAEDYGWLAEYWQVGNWAPEKIYVLFRLRSGSTFHNGDVVTPEDVKFSLEFMKAAGPGVSWAYSDLAPLVRVDTSNDDPSLGPRDVKVYFDVASFWAVHWAGFQYILNRSIWMAVNARDGWGYTRGMTDFNAFTNRMLIRNYEPWESDVDNDGIKDFKEDGTGPWVFQAYAGEAIDVATSVSFTAFSNYMLPQSAISDYLAWTFQMLGDVNQDGKVDYLDMLPVQKALGTNSGMLPWGTDWDLYNPAADINVGVWDMINQVPLVQGDGVVNYKDLNRVLSNLGANAGSGGAIAYSSVAASSSTGSEDMAVSYPYRPGTNGSVTNPSFAYDKDNATSADFDLGMTPNGNMTYFSVADFNSTFLDLYYVMAININMKYSLTASADTEYRIMLAVKNESDVIQNWLSGDSEPGLLIWGDTPEPNNGVWSPADVRNINISVESRKKSPTGTGLFKLYEVWVSFQLRTRLYVDDLSSEGTGGIADESLRPSNGPIDSYPGGSMGNASVTNPTYAYDKNQQTYASINIGATTYPYPSWFEVTTFTFNHTIHKPPYFFLDVKMNYSVTVSSAKYRILAVVGSKNTTMQDWTLVPRTVPSVRTFSQLREPNDGIWNWTDVGNLRIRVEVIKASPAGSGTFREYEVWASTPGNRFVAGVSITNVKNLYGYEFYLNWTGSILNVTRLSEGPLLRDAAAKQSASSFIFMKNYNDAKGNYTLVSGSLQNPAYTGADGTGVLAYVEFQVEAAYNWTYLTLYDTLLGDSFDPLISHRATRGWFDNRLAGDTNDDRSVNFTDFTVLAGAYGSKFGEPAYREEADINHNGDVGFSDFIRLAGNYGKTQPP